MGTRLGTELGTILGTVLGTDLGGGGGAPPVAPEIILFVGDSETAGRAQGAWQLPESASYGDGSALTWDWLTSAFVTASDVNSYQSLNGIVVPPGKSMIKPLCWYRAQAVGATVYGINCGWGATTTAQWLSGDTTTNGFLGTPGVNLVNTAIARANAARAAYPTATFKIVMYIGANDATAAGYGGVGVAKANCLATIAALRAGITGATNAEVFVWGLPNLTVANPYAANWTAIMNELDTIEDVPNGIFGLKAYRGWTWELYGIHPESLGYEDAAIRGASRMAGNADAFSTIADADDIADLHDYLDPAQGVTLNGSDAQVWTDAQSGIAYSQTATPAKQPAVGTSANLNNQTALTFVNDQLDAVSTSSLIYLQTGPCTVFFVIDVSVSHEGYILTTVSPGNATPGIVLRVSAASTTWFNYRAAGVFYGNTSVVDPVGATGKRWGVIRMNADNTIQMKVEDKWTWTSPTYSGSPSTSNHNPPRIGQNNNNLQFQGAIGEIIAYDRALTDYEIMKSTERLRAKFNLFSA